MAIEVAISIFGVDFAKNNLNNVIGYLLHLFNLLFRNTLLVAELFLQPHNEGSDYLRVESMHCVAIALPFFCEGQAIH